MKSYDAINIFAIDSNANVRPDSVPMMNAFRQICAEEGFDDFLQATLDRIGDIESLGRTRELTIKDLWEGGKYKVNMQPGGLTFECEKPEEDEDDDDKEENKDEAEKDDGKLHNEITS